MQVLSALTMYEQEFSWNFTGSNSPMLPLILNLSGV